MIDIHCHILPGVDDGPTKMKETLSMLAIARKSGVETIIATPHLLRGVNDEKIALCNELVKVLPRIASDAGIKIQVKSGFECYISPEFAEENINLTDLTLNNNGKYILIELPMNGVPLFTKDVFANIKNMGITPIIAHPERNMAISQNPNILCDFISDGCIAQLNAGSIIGHYGREIRQTAKILLSHRLIHVLASDMHSASSPMMKHALSAVGSIVGFDETLQISEKIPYNILVGEDFDRADPIPYEPKKRSIRNLLWKWRKREI